MRLLLVFVFAFSPLSAQQIFRTSTGGPPLSLDPLLYNDPGHLRFQAQVFEAPLEIGVDAEGRVRIQPAVTGLPEISEDGLTLRLTVEPGVRFTDDACFDDGKGRAVTGDDVVYSLQRHADPNFKSAYWNSFLAGRIVGLDAWREASASNGVSDYGVKVEGLATHEGVVVIKLLAPYPQLISLLSQPWASIVPREAVARYGSGFGDHAVGTGPFLFAGKDALGTVRFKKNPTYRLPGRPFLDEVRFEVIKENERLTARFLAGDLHVLDLWAQTQGEILSSRGKLKIDLQRKGISLATGLPLQIQYLVFNCKHRFLKDKKVRQALTLATNRERVSQDVLAGRGLEADSPVPPAFPEAAAIARRPYHLAKPDLKKAKRLLAEAGFPDGKGFPELVFDALSVEEVPESHAVALAMIKDWSRLGIKAQLRSSDYATFRERAVRGDLHVAWLSWFADYPDVENFLGLFRSTAPDNVYSYNYGFYKNEKYDELYDQFAKMYPGPRRTILVERMVDIVRDDCPWIFLAWERNAQAVQKGVRGFRSNVLNHSLRDVGMGEEKPGKK